MPDGVPVSVTNDRSLPAWFPRNQEEFEAVVASGVLHNESVSMHAAADTQPAPVVTLFDLLYSRATDEECAAAVLADDGDVDRRSGAWTLLDAALHGWELREQTIRALRSRGAVLQQRMLVAPPVTHMAELFATYGDVIDINAPITLNDWGFTPLHWAAKCRTPALATLLLEHGARSSLMVRSTGGPLSGMRPVDIARAEPPDSCTDYEGMIRLLNPDADE